MAHDHEYDENIITVVDEEGNEHLCQVIHTFDSEKFGKSYVLYSYVGAEEDEEGQIEIFASAFIPDEDGKDGELLPIETDEEWDLVEEVLNTLEEEWELEDEDEE